ncbi:helix-turn-helix domain-containing protein [Viridibacillus arvi]|uniref:helix-turn-helix domain-containing protein n=1 Tax=Viridibacillus arvi TaxID=263475 RepID=UPI0036EDC97C
MTELHDYPDVLSVKDVQAILGIGTNKAYSLAKSNAFHTVRIGPLIKIPKQSFLQWLNGSNN